MALYCVGVLLIVLFILFTLRGLSFCFKVCLIYGGVGSAACGSG